MGLTPEYIEGQTPLDDDEQEGLLITTITTRGELDEFEQLNIEEAIIWSLRRSFKLEDVFTESLIKTLHIKMYGNVWQWAGEFRKSNKNIGVDKFEISVELNKLLNDTIYWIENKVFEPDEIAIRFKHRLVSIHCFPNGNGRHSRLIADIIIEKIFKLKVFSWGANNLTHASEARKKYIHALRAADRGNYKTLLQFARS